jgi:hypothetical protein
VPVKSWKLERNMTTEERIVELEGLIEALNARLPKHSVPPSMIIELEDLEDELAALKRALGEQGRQSRDAVESRAGGTPGSATSEAPGWSNQS